MDLRALITKMDQLSEAEDPAAVIAKYQEMGKKPTADMPAFIDPKDGKVKYMDQSNASMGQQPQIKVMPSDWIKRYAPDLAAALAAQGGNKAEYGAQEKSGLFGIKGLGDFDQGTKVNTAQAGADTFSANFVKDMIAKISPLLDKVEKKLGVANYSLGGTDAKLKASEGIKFTSGIAKVLAESLGYQLDEAEAAADPDMVELDKLISQVLDIEDPTIMALRDRYQKLLKKKEEEAAAATAASSGAASSGAASGSAAPGDEAKKIARMKELLAKVKSKAGQAATPASAGGAGALSADTISQNAKPKTENMSEAEKYAAIRDRLAQIESRADEGLADLAKGAYAAGKGIFQAAKTGLSGAPVATGKLTKTGAAQMTGQGSQKFAKQLATMPAAQRGAYNAAKIVKNNPVKTALGATAVGATTGYALSGSEDPATQTATPTPAAPAAPGGGNRPAGGATPPATSGGASAPGGAEFDGLTPEEATELTALWTELGRTEVPSPEVAELINQYNSLKKK